MNPVASYDFTYPADDVRVDDFKTALRPLFKKWTFQLERGDDGYLHFQGRGSLYKKRRLHEAVSLFQSNDLEQIHLSITSNPAVGDAFYAIKADTRVGGPWSDRDADAYIPRQYRDVAPFSWQQAVIESALVFNPRTVNYVYDPDGSKGKSTIAALCCLLHKGIRVPAVNDHEKLLSSVCDILTAKQERVPGPIFIDLPRYMDKKRLHGIYSAIEEIKNGHVYDMRFHYKEWWFDSPPVWVFSNMEPEFGALSRDRWKVWSITENHLVPFVPG